MPFQSLPHRSQHNWRNVQLANHRFSLDDLGQLLRHGIRHHLAETDNITLHGAAQEEARCRTPLRFVATHHPPSRIVAEEHGCVEAHQFVVVHRLYLRTIIWSRRFTHSFWTHDDKAIARRVTWHMAS